MHEIEDALASLSAELLTQSGSVFYTGKQAFSGTRPLYLLGLNPGGDPLVQAHETIASHISKFYARREPWSAYADESWQGATPGNWGMQPRVLHMLRSLELDPRAVPASNVVFVRSRDEANLREQKRALLSKCWPVHEAVIRTLNVRIVVCFGSTAGAWVRDCLHAHRLVDQFQETNARGWRSFTHTAADGKIVVSLTHPGRADWRNSNADPTGLVVRALQSKPDRS